MDEACNEIDAWNKVYPGWVRSSDSGVACWGCTAYERDWSPVIRTQFTLVSTLFLWACVSTIFNLSFMVTGIVAGFIGGFLRTKGPTLTKGRGWSLEMQDGYLTLFVECGGRQEYSYTREELYMAHPEIADQIAIEMDRQYDLYLRLGSR